jgi:hypothetical protein
MNPIPMTETELALALVLTARREQGFQGQKSSIHPKTIGELDELFDAAHRFPGTQSRFDQFNASMQVEWAIRILSHLTDQCVDYDPRKVGQIEDAGWDVAQAEILRLYRLKSDAACVDVQSEYDACESEEDLKEFWGWHKGVVIEDGVVKDPWGVPGALWFLSHMTKYTVFTVWQVVYSAVAECMAENMGAWADGFNHEDPRTVANTVFKDAMWNLHEYLAKVLRAEAAAAKAAAAPIDTIADLLREVA